MRYFLFTWPLIIAWLPRQRRYSRFYMHGYVYRRGWGFVIGGLLVNGYLGKPVWW